MVGLNIIDNIFLTWSFSTSSYDTIRIDTYMPHFVVILHGYVKYNLFGFIKHNTKGHFLGISWFHTWRWYQRPTPSWRAQIILNESKEGPTKTPHPALIINLYYKVFVPWTRLYHSSSLVIDVNYPSRSDIMTNWTNLLRVTPSHRLGCYRITDSHLMSRGVPYWQSNNC